MGCCYITSSSFCFFCGVEARGRKEKGKSGKAFNKGTYGSNFFPRGMVEKEKTGLTATPLYCGKIKLDLDNVMELKSHR